MSHLSFLESLRSGMCFVTKEFATGHRSSAANKRDKEAESELKKVAKRD